MTKATNSLANNYRPHSLKDVIGQERVVKSLGNFLKGVTTAAGYKLQLPPVILLAGNTGAGKSTLARIIAASAICGDFNFETGEPCGVCPDCENALDEGVVNGSNFMFIEGGKKEVVETDLRHFVHKSPWNRARANVCIADEAQGLTQGARQALLTLTENLPARSHIIFTTTDPEAIDIAIRGRCTCYYLSPLGVDDLVDGVCRRRPDMDTPEARAGLAILARDSGGSMRQLWSWVQRWDSYQEPLTEDGAAVVCGGATKAMRDRLWACVDAGDFGGIEKTWHAMLVAGAESERLAKQLGRDMFAAAAEKPLSRDWTRVFTMWSQARDTEGYLTVLMAMTQSPGRLADGLNIQELAESVSGIVADKLKTLPDSREVLVTALGLLSPVSTAPTPEYAIESESSVAHTAYNNIEPEPVSSNRGLNLGVRFDFDDEEAIFTLFYGGNEDGES